MKLQKLIYKSDARLTCWRICRDRFGTPHDQRCAGATFRIRLPKWFDEYARLDVVSPILGASVGVLGCRCVREQGCCSTAPAASDSAA